MAVPSASPPDGLADLPKTPSSSSDPAPGTVEPQYGALHGTHTDLVQVNAKHPTEPAAGPAEQLPTTPAPVGGVSPASISSTESLPVQGTRETISRMDKDGDKSGPSSSPSAPSPAPSRSSAKKTSSPKANGNGNDTHRSLPTRTHKPSFFSRLFRALIPCVSSSPNSHPIEVHDTVSPSASKEKQPLTSFEHVVPTSPPTTTELAKDTPPLVSPVTVESSTLTPVEPVNSAPEQPSHEAEVPIQPTPPSPPHILPLDETEGVTSGAVQAPGSTGGSPKLEDKRHSGESTPPSNASVEEDSEGTSFTEDEDIDGLDEMEDEEDRLIMNGGAGIPIGPDGRPNPLLPPIAPHQAGRKCLILDLDETLVHSSFKSIQQADYVVPVEIEYHLHNVYVIKRPGVDKFLKKMGEIYEIVVFTASLSKYADPVLDKLDTHQVVSQRLFRESCYNHRGNYVKDLSQLGRPIADTIILDNSPASYIFHPNNAVPVSSWFNDPHDTELTDLIPFLTDLATVEDVRGVLDGAR
ncbi:hypothetical protein H2248_005157 [Termitomyces sp. 'cryptogamus']|nr:hypothetical protein H2248_005157 [Termitomyces sp. 'cryptogamus']